ncbi:MAG: hypothetical protein LBU04_06255 [Christensenellaceae bacterium]|jgi:hypothetical protein|nr:hypothetical protein [Christensenellaceae bacterium]
MMKNSKRFRAILVTVFLLLILMIMTLSSCKKPIIQPETKPETPVEKEETKISSSEVINKIIRGVQKAASPDDGYNFNVSAAASFVLPKKDAEDLLLDLKVNLSFDLDPTTQTANNLYIVELTQKKGDIDETLLSLYYKDNLNETPYLFVNVGGKKHAIKFMSVKKLVTQGIPGLMNPLISAESGSATNEIEKTADWSLQSILDLLDLGQFTTIVETFLLDGDSSIFKNPLISEDGLTANLEIDMENVKKFVSGILPLASTQEVKNTVDEIFSSIGIDMNFEKLTKILTELPDIEIKVNASFDSKGALTNLGVTSKFINDTGLKIDFANGKNVFDFTIPGGETVAFSISNIKVSAGAPEFTTLPDDVNFDNYSKHNLLNFELDGIVRLEYLKTVDGTNEEWNAVSGYSFVYKVQSDLDPFALLNGVDSEHLEDSIKNMGKFNILVSDKRDTSETTIAEIAFDPATSGDDGLYVSLVLRGLAGLVGMQSLKFDVSDLADWIRLKTNASSIQTVKANAENDSASSSGLSGILDVINSIKGIVELLGLKIYDNYPYASFGVSIDIRNIEVLSDFADFLLDYGGERLFIGFNNFSYGTADTALDGFTHYLNENTFVVSAEPHESVMTEYKYGQQFQDGWSTVDMMVKYSVKGKVDTQTTRKSLKVIGMNGFVTTVPGEHVVELFLIAPTKSSLFGYPIYDAFANANLPYGIFKYTYTITVAEKESDANYSLATDYLMTGESIFNSRAMISKSDNNRETVINIASFELFTEQNGVKSNAIDENGIAKIVGKYWIKATTVDGIVFEQILYINSISIPDLQEKLIYGKPVSDLAATVSCYDQESGVVVIKKVLPQQNSLSYSYLDIREGTIIGDGTRPNVGSETSSSIKYVYEYASKGSVLSKQTNCDRLAVTFDQPKLTFITIASSYGPLYEGMQINQIGRLLRSDGKLTYSINTANGSGLRWVNGKYQLFDMSGNLVADTIEIVIRASDSDTAEIVTDKYYDKSTGRFKIKEDSNGNLLYVGSEKSAVGLRLEITAKFGELSAQAKTKIDLYPKYRTSTTKTIDVLQGGVLPYRAFVVYAYNDITNVYSSSSYQLKHNPRDGYHVVIGSKKHEVKSVFYELGTKNVIDNVFSSDGRMLLSAGKYTAKIFSLIDGVEVAYEHTVTVKASIELKVAQNSKIDAASSLQYYNPNTSICSTSGKLNNDDKGYFLLDGSNRTNINLTDITITSQAGEKINGAIDENGNVTLAAGSYKISIIVKFHAGNVVFDGNLTVRV